MRVPLFAGDCFRELQQGLHRSISNARSSLRLAPLLALALLYGAISSSAAPATASEYAIESAAASLSTTTAGAHPDIALSFRLATDPDGVPAAVTRDFSFELPPGLLANPAAFPRCSGAELAGFDDADPSSGCPVSAQVGTVQLEALLDRPVSLIEPLYNMAPASPDAVARFGFIAQSFPTVIDVRLRSAGDYGLTASLRGASSAAPLIAATTSLWGVPSDPVHDAERITAYEALHQGFPQTPSGRRQSGWPRVPFTANPTRCGEPLAVRFTAASYALPDRPVSAAAPLPAINGCGALSFLPSLSLVPGSSAPDSPSGLTLRLSAPSTAFEQPSVRLGAAPRGAVVQLASALTVNPPAADGLDSCDPEQIGLRSASPPACPAASKLGIAEAATPLLRRPLEGALYLATPHRNPFDALFAAYLVLEGEGVTLKLPLRLDADPASGDLTATLSDLPQLPFSDLLLRFWDGPRALLRTPPACGAHISRYLLSSWSRPDPFPGTSSFRLTAPCAIAGFAPTLTAGTLNPRAGAASPLRLELQRGERQPALSALSLTLPPGLAAELASVPPCPEPLPPQGACPQDSRVGSASLAAGSGPAPLWIPSAGHSVGDVYLAGPFHDAPYSLLIAIPAQAGPFDLRPVVLRAPLQIDPETAQATISINALPQILAGVPLQYRTLRLLLDRPGFIRNPTSCAPMQISGTATASDGARAALGDRFRAVDCAALRFRPRVTLDLLGGLGRNAHPGLRAVLRSAPAEAAIATASFTLPSGELLDLRRLRALCARDLPASSCPPSSRLGFARFWSSLVGAPLEGPIYLREPTHRLPGLISEVRGGGVRFILHGDTAAPHGRLRVQFSRLPDIPLAKAVISLAGGRDGIIANSESLCPQPRRATATVSAQNGKRHQLRPRVRLRASC